MSTTRKVTSRAAARLRDLGRSIRATLAAYRDRLAAAALYNDLFRLSDAELQRRGLCRADLHRMVSEDDSTGSERKIS